VLEFAIAALARPPARLGTAWRSDLSEAVETAHEVLAGLPNAHVVQGDIHHPPFRLGAAGGEFDFVYSIGVLHHLPDRPRRAAR